MILQVFIHRNSINSTVLILFGLAAVFLVMFYISCGRGNDGFKKVDITETKKYWFKYGGTKIPWPLHWQGWAYMGIFVLFSLLFMGIILHFNVNKIIIVPVLAVLWAVYLIGAILKSDFKEQLGFDGKMSL